MAKNYFAEKKKRREAIQAITDEDAERCNQKKLEKDGFDSEGIIEDAIDRINELAGRAYRWLVKSDESFGELMETEIKNVDIDSDDTFKHVSQLTVLVLSICVALSIDFYFFGSFVTWLLELLGKGESTISAGQYIVPIVVVCIEVLVSVPLYTSRKDGNRITEAALTIIGVGLILGFTAVTVATFKEGLQLDSLLDITFTQALLALPMIFISLAVHSMIVFSGKLGYEAKAYLGLLICRRIVRIHEWISDMLSEKVVAFYRKCLRLERRHRQKFDDDFEIPPEEFSAEARYVINTKTGRECIPDPDSDQFRGNGTAEQARHCVETGREG